MITERRSWWAWFVDHCGSRACAEAGFYGQVVYNVRVSRYIDWIESISRDASH
jgi:secreted trypsin-like serine protease